MQIKIKNNPKLLGLGMVLIVTVLFWYGVLSLASFLDVIIGNYLKH